MQIFGTRGRQVALGGALVGFAVTKLISQLFLAAWDIASVGQSDIAARGAWILALYLPIFGMLSVCSVTGLVALRSWHSTHRVIEILHSGVGASVGASLILFGLDPTSIALNAVNWDAAQSYYVVSASLAAVLAAWGVVWLVQLTSARNHYERTSA